MDILNSIREKASKQPKKIIFPEGDEPRVIEAVRIILENNIARVILLGEEKILKEKNLDKYYGKISIINPEDKKLLDKLSKIYYELRKHKGVTLENSLNIIKQNKVFLSALLVREAVADGFVAGASFTTKDVAKAAIHCLRSKNYPTVSSSFLLILPDTKFGVNGALIFADCGIIPEPTSSQLKDITISSSYLLRQLLDVKPKVALLSYSTKGSAKGASVEKVIEAYNLLKSQKDLDIVMDGELQVDAALVPEIANRKAPGSRICGDANILIFPNLDAGNIAYKLVRELAKAKAIGPILQGLSKPASDLSRGCSIDDIVDATAITVVRAQTLKLTTSASRQRRASPASGKVRLQRPSA